MNILASVHPEAVTFLYEVKGCAVQLNRGWIIIMAIFSQSLSSTHNREVVINRLSSVGMPNHQGNHEQLALYLISGIVQVLEA